MHRDRLPEEKISLFEQIIEHSSNAIFIVAGEETLLFANQAGERLWHRLNNTGQLHAALTQKTPVLKMSDGCAPHYIKPHVVLTQAAPAAAEYLFIGTDISAELLAQREERRLRRRLEQTMEITEEGFWLWDIEKGWVSHNHCWSRLFGFDESILRHHEKEIFSQIHPEDAQRVRESVAAHLRGETAVFRCDYRVVNACGNTLWIRNTGKAVRYDNEGVALEMLGKATDITDVKARELEMHQLAWHDHLTQLDNRSRFYVKVDNLRQQTRVSGQYAALLYLDLNRFKEVNDTLGHAAGDRLLIEVARRLRNTLRTGDTIARIGGDEFAILIHPLSTEYLNAHGRLVILANRLIEAIEQDIALEGAVVSITTSIGIYLFQSEDEPVSEMLHKADTAQYYSKRNQRKWMLWSPRLGEEQTQRDSIETGLRRALDNNELFMLYQPQYSRQGEVNGVEALLRWRTPSGRLIPPSTFIPVAEHSGLMLNISHWVMDQVCQQLHHWQSQPALAGLRVSMNISPRQLKRNDFIKSVEQAISRHGLQPGLLSMEMLESSLTADMPDAQRKLSALKEMQVQVALDNFGTGNASLSGLRKLAIGEVKIDRSFVLDMARNPDNLLTIRAIVAMCQALGIDIVAEGVEKPEQFSALSEMGCHRFQGWLFSRAVSADKIATLL